METTFEAHASATQYNVSCFWQKAIDTHASAAQTLNWLIASCNSLASSPSRPA